MGGTPPCPSRPTFPVLGRSQTHPVHLPWPIFVVSPHLGCSHESCSGAARAQLPRRRKATSRRSWTATAVLAASVAAAAGGQRYVACDRPKDAWDYVRYLDQDIAAVSTLPREGREVLYELYRDIIAGPGREAAVENCVFGVIAVMLHSLPYIDRDLGEAAARKAFWEARQLLADFSHHASGHWQLDMRHHEAAAYLLGAEPVVEPASCSSPGFRPRFFVYDTGKYTRPLLSCAAGMEGTEALLHRFLLRSSCRTEDPDIANYFFVPFYSFCFQNFHIAPGNETEELDRHNLAVVRSLSHFDMHRRPAHIFHFPHEFWDFPSWEAHVGRSMLWAIEANPIVDVVHYQHCITCFDPRKDLVIPGHTDRWTIQRLRELNIQTMTERRRDVCFHGSLEHELYERTHADAPFNNVSAAETRRQIRSLHGREGTSIGGHITPVLEYYRVVSDCRFCLVPKGVGFTNGRLLEAFFAGCIPVILSDAMQVPFQDILDWPSFSVKAPMGNVLGTVDSLLRMPLDTLEQMKRNLDYASCWFDYYSNDPACSPYEGILQMLKLQRARQQSGSTFW